MDYTTLKANAADWLAKSDLSDLVLSTFVTFAEARTNRSLRVSAMEKPYFRALDADSSTGIPADYIEFKELFLYTGTGPQDVLPALNGAWVQRVRRTSGESLFDGGLGRRGDVPLSMARVGTRFQVSPVPNGNYSLGGIYYGKFAALSDVAPTNWLTDNTPDLLLCAVLSEAAAYGKAFDQVEYWVSRFTAILSEVQGVDERERSSGSQTVMRSGVSCA